jgi:hypothetical protein
LHPPNVDSPHTIVPELTIGTGMRLMPGSFFGDSDGDGDGDEEVDKLILGIRELGVKTDDC